MPKSLQLTPMLRHYLEVKAQHPDAILLYRMGDFYEMFFDDAREAAPILEVTLTARQRGSENEAPMCGVPHHALKGYLGKLLRAGKKVAICDQVEDPAKAKGLVRREVTRVVTPGTISDPGLLESAEANYLGSLFWAEDQGAGAFLDISTGSFSVRRWHHVQEALDELAVLRPQEVLYPADGLPDLLSAWLETAGACRTQTDNEDWPTAREAAGILQDQLGTGTLKGFGLEPGEPAVQAAAAALRYARETQQSELSHVQTLHVGESADCVVLDSVTAMNLELFETLRERKRRGSLLWVLDQTVSPAGGRLLRSWLQRPLREVEEIKARQIAVKRLLADNEGRTDLRTDLARVGDPERLVARAVLGSLTPREAATLRDGVILAPRILEAVDKLDSPLLQRLATTDPAQDLLAEIERVLESDPPSSIREGGVIRSGVDADLDHHRSLVRDSRQHILALERREKESTGIQTLKIRYNKVFGYYLEVTKANQKHVPADYIRKQTLVNSERYITPELKELEEKILAAEAEQSRLEEEYFLQLRDRIAMASTQVNDLATALATVDVLAGLAEVAARYSYVMPRIGGADKPHLIRDGRHPVVERLSSESFVPNDTELTAEDCQIVILTGPNMGGKSTYLRQTALIVLMAHLGSFVPASEAEIGSVDRIFTRVGASDDLSRGESTFMVEMIETAKILHQCTAESLVILDEVGRGTATFDGLSLAWAIVEHLHEKGRPRTLFATHYHELTELATLLPRVVNKTMAVKEWEDRIVFLRRVVAGSSDKSYGLHVARLAGIPGSVLDRAGQILGNLEAHEYDLSGKPRLARGGEPGQEGPDQLTLFAPTEEVVAAVLRDLDVEKLSPLAALNLLHALKSRLLGP